MIVLFSAVFAFVMNPLNVLVGVTEAPAQV